MTEAGVTLMINLMVACFGLLIGSFLNVVIYRLPRDLSIVRPGSRCQSCEAPIRAWQNIPVLSYLFLRGKCAKCHAKISLRYPVVELLTAVLFVAVFQKFGIHWLTFFRDLPFVALLIAITFIDLDHRLILDEFSLGGLFLGLLTAHWVPGFGLISSVMGAVAGFSFFYGFAWLYERMTGRSGLGGGDVKFLAMLGAFIGIEGVLTTIFISSVAGSIIGITWAKWSNRTSSQADAQGETSQDVLKVAIPYGPFLVIGALYYYLLGDLLWLPFTIPT